MKDSAGAFRIFRMATSPSLDESGAMEFAGLTEPLHEQMSRLLEAGIDNGNVVKMLFKAPGYSLSHSWFKAGFPLPLHSHNSACLYYIVAGTLRLGTETLGPGDGFFVPASAPYTYTPGESGVEILEFRHEEEYDFRFVAKAGAPFWDKAVKQITDKQEQWRDAVPPHVTGS